MKKVVSIFILVICSLTAYAQERPRSVDASQFDLAGVKIGMTLSEVEQALIHKYGIHKNDIQYSPNNISNPLVPRRMDVQYLGATVNKDERIYVGFTPCMQEPDRSKMVAYEVTYQIAYSPINQERLKAAVAEKYGIPSNARDEFADRRWCQTPTIAPLGAVQCHENQETVLIMGDIKLQLVNRVYTKALEAYLNPPSDIKPNF